MRTPKNKKYGLVEMHKRFKGIALPKINTIDIRKAHRKKKMIYQFSPEMIHAIEDTLVNRKQVILFQNRRGYSPALSCQNCSHTPNCNPLSISSLMRTMIHQLFFQLRPSRARRRSADSGPHEPGA